MALRRRKEEPAPPIKHKGKSLVASSAILSLEGAGIGRWRFGDDSWQQEAWRLYDVIGELRYVANWVGSALSRVRIYVANVDKNGRIQDETKQASIAGLASNLFGGPAGLSEAMRMMGVNLTVAGDVYVVARDGQDPSADPNDPTIGEDWQVLSCTELKRWGPGYQNVAWMYGDTRYEKEPLDPTKDLIIRIWTPHPRRQWWADSPTRGAMPMLWEIERLTKYVFAQIDSRLFSAGLMFIPKEMSFPDEDPELSPSEAMTERLMRIGSASLKGEGTAAGVVPMFAEVPTDALGKINLVTFASDLSKQAMELRTEAIKRLALAMDIDPNILSGMGEANHWGAWQIMAEQIKIHVEPLMSRICDGLTEAYLKPALKKLKEDPERYVFWYDTAPLVIRPQRLQDTQAMFKDGLVSRAAVLLNGDYSLSDAPSTEEDMMMFTRQLMLRDPNLLSNAALRKVAGYTDDILPANTVIQPPGLGSGPPPPPAPPTGIAGGPAGSEPPVNSTAINAPGGPADQGSIGGSNDVGGAPSGVTASMNVFLLSNATVLRAMERASRRMLTKHTLGRFPEVPAHELHSRQPINVTYEMTAQLLEGSWDQMGQLAAMIDPNMEVGELKRALESYCAALLIHKTPHSPQLLGDWLNKRGLINGDT